MISNNDFLSAYIPLKATRSRLLTGFTLIELIIVISIVAVLSSIVIIAINPPKLLQESRDLKRMSDMASIDKAINQLMGYAVTSSIFGGQPNTVYISIPDASSTCANLGLPNLPSGWSYSCSTQSNFRNVNGTGWLPINFSALSIGSPLSNLPIDPKNQTSTGQYYTYVTGGSYELTAVLESSKFIDKAVQDGGPDPIQYEIGDDLNLAPFVRGLIGYWKFDEISGITANDFSGLGNNGTLTDASSTSADGNTPPISTSTAKVGRALVFDGADDYINLGDPTVVDFGTGDFTFASWIKLNSITTKDIILGKDISGNRQFNFHANIDIGGTFQPGRLNIAFYIPSIGTFRYQETGNNVIDTNWHHVVGLRRGASLEIWMDGVQQATTGVNPSAGDAMNAATGNLTIGRRDLLNEGDYFDGFIDEVRIYNHALSASQIKAIYDATK